MMLVNVRLDISGLIGLHFKAATSLVQLLSNSKAKTKLAILAFFYCGVCKKYFTTCSKVKRLQHEHVYLELRKLTASPTQGSVRLDLVFLFRFVYI